MIAQTASGLLEGSDIGPAQTDAAANSSQARTFQISSAPLVVKSGATLNTAPVFVLPAESAATIHPRMIGMNGELSTIAVPLKAGKTFTIYVGGEGIDQLAEFGISTSSPLIKVVPKTLTSEEFGADYPVISFQVTVDSTAEAGDYSIRLQSPSGELSYLPGVISIRKPDNH